MEKITSDELSWNTAFGDNKFVVVGDTSIHYSLDNGLNWIHIQVQYHFQITM